jgi:hypothetical protein
MSIAVSIGVRGERLEMLEEGEWCRTGMGLEDEELDAVDSMGKGDRGSAAVEW